jgi:hypothetical protein
MEATSGTRTQRDLDILQNIPDLLRSAVGRHDKLTPWRHEN